MHGEEENQSPHHIYKPKQGKVLSFSMLAPRFQAFAKWIPARLLKV
jgi:hypothetical protein